MCNYVLCLQIYYIIIIVELFVGVVNVILDGVIVVEEDVFLDNIIVYDGKFCVIVGLQELKLLFYCIDK